jgi:hypothetical protein
MRFVIEGRLRRSCGLTPAEFFDLAVREWEMVLGWLSSGVALTYGRPVSVPGGALLVEVGSEADARALAASLPLAPYAEVTVRRTDILGVPPAARDRTVQNQAKRAVAPPVDKVVAAQQREPELLTSNDPVQVVDLWVEVFLPSPSVPPRPEIRSDL